MMVFSPRPIRGLSLLLPLLLLFPAVSAEAEPEDLQHTALGQLQGGNWQAAASSFEQLTELDPENAQNWAYLGIAYRNLERWDEAIAAYDKALAVDGANVSALAGLAITLEKSGGAIDRSMSLLTEAVRLGLPASQLRTSPVFEGLKAHAGFAAVLEIADRIANPCRSGPPYDDFDFWIGDWDVTMAGQKVARNLITKEMNGCLVRERFQAPGSRGESINYFDPETGHWKQNWVSGAGGITRYEGGLRAPGVMFMEGANSSPDGSTRRARVTWTRLEDGTVQHVIGHSTDDGATWNTVLDAIYLKSDRETPTILD